MKKIKKTTRMKKANDMKKNLLIAMFGLILATGFSQNCTPDPLYQDSVFGAWPDTLTNLPEGMVGVMYSEDLNFKIPLNASDIDPAVSGTIDSATVTAVNGLPPGLSYGCNTSGCVLYGGQQGCANVYGVPTTQGSYPIDISVLGYLQVFGFPITFPYSFSGYKIDVTTLSISEIQEGEFLVSQNIPNPAINETTIKYYTKAPANIELRLINMLGEVVYANRYDAIGGNGEITLSTESLKSGIYMYSVINGNQTVTKRMIVKK